MRLLAIADLHASHPPNRAAIEALRPHPDDWLMLAGDLGDRPEQIEAVFALLAERFARVIWAPGNHDLWSLPTGAGNLRGEALYAHLVALARRHGVRTPEDPYEVFEHPSGPVLIAPLFLLYDYSFRPAHVPLEGVIAWARETANVCADERYLHPDPHPTRAAWCAERVRLTAERLETRAPALPTVLLNHYPLKQAHAVLPAAPRFTPWCGATLTEDWHRRFDARAVVHGHLHIRKTRWTDGVPFQEVSLGYPRQWDQALGIEAYLREVRLAAPRL
ncbi:MAG: metallophosphoesterase [Pseudomonadota bacterium]